MTDKARGYYAGQGCTCYARAGCYCSCGVDWTDPRVYRLEQQIKELIAALELASIRFKTDPCLRGNEWLDAAESCDKAIAKAKQENTK